MSWFVKDHEDDDENEAFYEDYEMAEALADFFRRVSSEETALLKWSY